MRTAGPGVAIFAAAALTTLLAGCDPVIFPDALTIRANGSDLEVAFCESIDGALLWVEVWEGSDVTELDQDPTARSFDMGDIVLIPGGGRLDGEVSRIYVQAVSDDDSISTAFEPRGDWKAINQWLHVDGSCSLESCSAP